jgi:flagellar assembly protein FliH
MTARLRLEVFRQPALPEDAMLTREEAEERALAAFEKGYADGWDDAARAHLDADSKVRADISAHLQALSFGFIEAREHVTASVAPLLRAMVEGILPGVADLAIARATLHRLQDAATQMADTPVVLLMHPETRRLVEPMIAALSSVPVTLRNDAALGIGQLYLQSEAGELCIDVDAALAELRRAVDDLLPQPERSQNHG